MNEERRAQWIRVIRKARRGEPVSPQEHDALLREGLFFGLSDVAAEEEARYVVRYLLAGEDLSDIPHGVRWRPRTGSPCGTSGARNARWKSSAG